MRSPRRFGSCILSAALALSQSISVSAQTPVPASTPAPTPAPQQGYFTPTPAPWPAPTPWPGSTPAPWQWHSTPAPAPMTTPTPTWPTPTPTWPDYWTNAPMPGPVYYGTSAPPSSGGSWSEVGDGLWSFQGGWNWDTPYPPSGITCKPDMKGEIALMPRQKAYFDRSQGFVVANSSSRGRCPHRFCLHISFSSSYGAISDFDAFVMDRYESKSAIGSDSFREGGPVPLVAGVLKHSELRAMLNDNWTEISNSRYNQPRKTSWMLYPLSSDADEIDIVMSFKQLYTLLPDYNGTNSSSNGPFYSDDFNEQVVLRVTARLASPFSASTAVVPLVLDHKGSQLFEVNYTSSILYPDDGSYNSNEIALDVVFGRKRYGGFTPWMPAQQSSECSMCESQMMGNPVFQDCLVSHVSDSVFTELLSSASAMTSFDLRTTRDKCFQALWSNSSSSISSSFSSSSFLSSSSSSSSSSFSSSRGSVSAGDELPLSPMDAVMLADAGIRCFIDSQCPIEHNLNSPSNGSMVVFASQKAFVRATFLEPEYSFSMTVKVDEDDNEHVTSEIASGYSENAIEGIVKRAIPQAELYNLNITVRLSNNSEDIAELNRRNEWLMNDYWYTVWKLSSASSASSSSSQSSSGDSNMDAGMAEASGSVGGAAGGSGSTDNMGETSGSGETLGPQQRRRLWAVNSANVAPPVLYEIPAPNFTVEVIFGNVSVVPIVTGVRSSRDVSWEYHPSQIAFDVAPLNVNKFSYVPPPPHVNLEWHDDPSFNPDGGSSFFPGTCGECVDHYRECEYDEDCRFGIRKYLYNALQRYNFKSGDFSVDITWVFRDAKMYVPAGGLRKFSRFISCLTSRSPVCNVDSPRMEESYSPGDYQLAPPTSLRIEPSRTYMAIDRNSWFSIASGDRHFSYYEDGDTERLQSFLEQTIGLKDEGVSISVGLGTSWNDSNRLSYSFTFYNYLSDAPLLSSSNSTTEITHFPGQIYAETPYRQGVSPTVEWRRLLEWLHSISYDMGSGDTGTTPNNNQTAPTNPDAICSTCMDKLSDCLSDYECASGTRVLLQTSLSPSTLKSNITHDANEAQFASALASSKSQFTTRGFQKLLNLLNCLSPNDCAVGYSPMETTGTQYPTWVSAYSRAGVIVQPYSLIEISYNGSMYTYQDTGSLWDFQTFVTQNVLGGAVNVDVYSWNTSDGRLQYGITVDRFLSEFPVILSSNTAQVTSQVTSAVFITKGSSPPNWNNLLQWFDAQPKTDSSGNQSDYTNSDAVCMKCASTVMRCINDPVCFQTVRDRIIPQLRSTQYDLTSNAGFSANYDGVHTTYNLDLKYLMNDLASNSALFASLSSWNAFSDALKCFSNSPCDLEYMTAAAEPPATAHVPTYMRFRAGYADLALFLNTQLDVRFRDQHFTFVQNDDASSFVTWLTQLSEEWGTVFFSKAEHIDGSGEFQYFVEFQGYVGVVPEIVVSSANGSSDTRPRLDVQPPKLWFESVNQLPAWQKLIDYFYMSPSWTTSPTSEPSISAPYQCSTCATALHTCFDDSTCQYVLTYYAIPAFREVWASTFDEGRYVSSNFGTRLQLNILPMVYSRQSQEYLMDVLMCSAASTCIDASCAFELPNDHASLILEDGFVNFTVAPSAQMNISFAGSTYTYQENDDVDALQRYLSGTVMGMYRADAKVQRSVVADSGLVHYHIEFPRLYTQNVPHLSVRALEGDPTTGFESMDTPWRFVFSSTTDNLHRAIKWWLEWLATNGNTVATTAPSTPTPTL